MSSVSLEDSKLLGVLQQKPEAMAAFSAYKQAFSEGDDGVILGAKQDFKEALETAGVAIDEIDTLANVGRDIARDSSSCRSCGKSFVEQLGQVPATDHGVSAAF